MTFRSTIAGLMMTGVASCAFAQSARIDLDIKEDEVHFSIPSMHPPYLSFYSLAAPCKWFNTVGEEFMNAHLTKRIMEFELIDEGSKTGLAALSKERVQEAAKHCVAMPPTPTS